VRKFLLLCGRSMLWFVLATFEIPVKMCGPRDQLQCFEFGVLVIIQAFVVLRFEG
jgi:hypothetical protein